MIADSILKGALLKFKRAPFACQKGIFYNAKGRLLQAYLQPFDYLMITNREMNPFL